MANDAGPGKTIPKNNGGPVVLIEDDRAFRDDLQEQLEARGIPVIPLDSGTHFLKFIQLQSWSWQPRMIITDLVMPGMGGYQLIRRINEIYPRKNVPMVVVSRLNAVDDVLEAEIAGAAAYCAKPLPTDKVADVVHHILTEGHKGKIKFVYDIGVSIKPNI